MKNNPSDKSKLKKSGNSPIPAKTSTGSQGDAVMYSLRTDRHLHYGEVLPVEMKVGDGDVVEDAAFRLRSHHVRVLDVHLRVQLGSTRSKVNVGVNNQVKSGGYHGEKRCHKPYMAKERINNYVKIGCLYYILWRM